MNTAQLRDLRRLHQAISSQRRLAYWICFLSYAPPTYADLTNKFVNIYGKLFSMEGINMGITRIDTERFGRKKAILKITAKMKILICNSTREDELNHLLSHYDRVEDEVDELLRYYDSVIMSKLDVL